MVVSHFSVMRFAARGLSWDSVSTEAARTHDHGEGGVDGRADIGAAEVDGHQRLVNDGQDAGLRALGRLPEGLIHLGLRLVGKVGGLGLRSKVHREYN